MGSPLNPKARKVGKLPKNPGKGSESLPGSESSHKLDPKSVQSYGAFCPDCGSLGNYLNYDDAANAEKLHQQRKHGNSVHKKTTTVEMQNLRNKGKGGR